MQTEIQLKYGAGVNCAADAGLSSVDVFPPNQSQPSARRGTARDPTPLSEAAARANLFTPIRSLVCFASKFGKFPPRFAFPFVNQISGERGNHLKINKWKKKQNTFPKKANRSADEGARMPTEMHEDRAGGEVKSSPLFARKSADGPHPLAGRLPLLFSLTLPLRPPSLRARR